MTDERFRRERSRAGDRGVATTLDASATLRYHESLVDAMGDAVVGTDADFRVNVWNRAAEQLYGYTAEEAMGRLAREVATYEGDESRLRLEDALERDGRAHVEFVARRKAGSFVDVELIAAAVQDEDGVTVGYLGIHRDISARKRVDAEHRRLSAIVQHSSDFIGMADLAGHVLFLNEAGQRLVGLHGLAEAQTKRLLDFVPPDARDRVRDELVPQIIAKGHATWQLDLMHFETGRRIPVSCDGFRVDDTDTGEVIALATISRDLTERRRSEAEVRAYRRQIDTIFASITDAFYAVDRDFRFTYLNHRAVQLLGDLMGEPVTLDDLLGRDAFSTVPGSAGTPAERNFREAMRDRRTVVFELQHPDGARFFEINVYPSGDGLAVYFREISDRKAAEAARERQARQQAAVAELGVRASHGEEVVALMEEAAEVVSRTLEVELVAVAERLPDRTGLLLRAGVGWEPGHVGRTEIGSGPRSLFGSAVQTGAPIVSDDLTREEAWGRPHLLVDHAVRSAAVVAIPGRRAPIGALGVFSRSPRTFGRDEINFLRAIANVLYSAIERAQMVHRVREVRDAERRRIARALHDETLQELGVALARAGRAAPPGAADDSLVATLQRVGAQIRAAVHDLRLSEDSGRSFTRCIEELVDFHRSTAPHCDFDVAIRHVPEHLPDEMSTHVLRILGEALTNVRRHAAAGRVEVRVAVTDGALVAVVADDGRGLGAGRRPGSDGGHGLAGMYERAELLAGDLRIEPRPGGGTEVELCAPLFEPRPRRERVRVLLVDDHAAIREAMALAFADDDGFAVAGQAGSMKEARTMLAGVDVAIIDLSLPDGSGADLIAELRAVSPDAQAVVLSGHVDHPARARAVEKGAAAVLSKATHLHDVVGAVRRVRAGETLIPLDEVVELLRFAGRERERVLDERRVIESLTPREREVLQLLADGLDGQRVAARLHISPRTQRNHMANILAKLGVHSQLQALLFALRHGLVEVPTPTAPER